MDSPDNEGRVALLGSATCVWVLVGSVVSHHSKPSRRITSPTAAAIDDTYRNTAISAIQVARMTGGVRAPHRLQS